MMFSGDQGRGTRIIVTDTSTPNATQGFYDGDGKLVSPETSTRKLWASVMDKKALGGIFGGQTRDNVDLALEVDYKSSKNLKIGQKLTIDKDNNDYAIVDFYEKKWKFSTVIIAKLLK